MALYWSGGVSLIVLRTPVSNGRAALATLMYVLGVVLMLALTLTRTRTRSRTLTLSKP